MNGAKIQFSNAEMELINNANIILTKNQALEKVRLLLQEAQQQMVAIKNDHPLFLLPPKISKGENYLGLPYLVLDYPRQFRGENMAMIRCLFWWGNFFSATLHLAGESKNKYIVTIKNEYEGLAAAGYYICINPDAWQHHFNGDNYCSINSLNEDEFRDCCNRFSHIKIAAKWPLEEAHNAANNLIKSWRFFLQLTGSITT